MVVCAERLRRRPVKAILAGSTPVHHPYFSSLAGIYHTIPTHSGTRTSDIIILS